VPLPAEYCNSMNRLFTPRFQKNLSEDSIVTESIGRLRTNEQEQDLHALLNPSVALCPES
jgi:hypothetical protein